MLTGSASITRPPYRTHRSLTARRATATATVVNAHRWTAVFAISRLARRRGGAWRAPPRRCCEDARSDLGPTLD